MEKKRIVERFAKYDKGDLQDALLMIAANIEEAMIRGGAMANTDYKILDIFQLAMQYINAPLDDQKTLGQEFYTEF
jgi:hypothetical protein